jgi:hypothetical protein
MINYNLEVVMRKGYWKGSLDKRGLRYTDVEKCGTYNCESDAKLISFYEDGMYEECAECWELLCEECTHKHPEKEGCSICIDCSHEKKLRKNQKNT